MARKFGNAKGFLVVEANRKELTNELIRNIMAKIFENKKGFLVMEVERNELMDALKDYGCAGVCDMCMGKPEKGYYIAVLNMWVCEKCFKEWYLRAKKYEEDEAVERKNFEFYKNLLM